MRSGSRMPALSITKRDLMPEAFSMNSTEEGVSAAISPAAMASALSALKRRDVGVEGLDQLGVRDADGGGVEPGGGDDGLMHGYNPD